MGKAQKKKNVLLPSSLRRHIRQRKAELRRQFGKDSEQYENFLAWIEAQRQGKMIIGEETLQQNMERAEE